MIYIITLVDIDLPVNDDDDTIFFQEPEGKYLVEALDIDDAWEKLQENQKLPFFSCAEIQPLDLSKSKRLAYFDGCGWELDDLVEDTSGMFTRHRDQDKWTEL